MKTIALITEYNPFHKGHAWQLAHIRRAAKADRIIVIMSGDFVQRGTPALFDKYTRCRMALLGGADLVLELPIVAATGSAQRFAEGAVSILDSLGVVDELWFGSESGQISHFMTVASMLQTESPAFQELLKEGLRSGLSFPAARAQALLGMTDEICKVFSSKQEADSFLSQANNILGLEYCIALQKLSSSIRPQTHTRLGEAYHSQALDGVTASATGIREAIRRLTSSSGDASAASSALYASVCQNIPPETLSVFEEALAQEGPVFEDDFSTLLTAKLLAASPESLRHCLDVPDGLSNRILNERNCFRSYSHFAGHVKTRELTLTAVNRALLHILLDIRKEDLETLRSPGSVRMLGFRRDSSDLLAAIKNKSRVTLIGGAAKMSEYLYKKDAYASNLYESVRAVKTGQDTRHEFSRSVVII